MTNTLEDALVALTDLYNASQDRVVVELQNQNGYSEVIDKYFQSSQDDRPDMVQMPEYMVQQMADTNSVIPIGACIQAEGFDTAEFLPACCSTYHDGRDPVVDAVQRVGAGALLQPQDVRGGRPRPGPAADHARRDAGDSRRSSIRRRRPTAWALDTGVDSGGGWFLEQWFARTRRALRRQRQRAHGPRRRCASTGPSPSS